MNMHNSSPGHARAPSPVLSRIDALLLNAITRNPTAALLHIKAEEGDSGSPAPVMEDYACRRIVEGPTCWRDVHAKRPGITRPWP